MYRIGVIVVYSSGEVVDLPGYEQYGEIINNGKAPITVTVPDGVA